MITEELKKELERLSNIKAANSTDNEKIIKTYRAIFGDDIYLCVKCPATIRLAYKKLMQYYEKLRR
jgi:hypothetical protein